MLFAKTCTHWLLTGLPLALSAPIAAAALGVSVDAMGGVVASLASFPDARSRRRTVAAVARVSGT
jgi:ABC-type transport system involved in cytochrome c biogenesis permease component